MAETGTGPDEPTADSALVDGALVDGALVDGALVDGALAEKARADGPSADIVPADSPSADITPSGATPLEYPAAETAPPRRLLAAAAAGLIAACAGATAIGGLSLLLAVRLPFLSVVVGGLIGAVVVGAGRRPGRSLAALGAVLAILAAAAGELLSAAVVVAQSAKQVGFGVRWSDVLTQIGPRALLQTDLSLHKSTLLFWALGAAVAGYLGYAGLRTGPAPDADESPDVAPDGVAADADSPSPASRDEVPAG